MPAGYGQLTFNGNHYTAHRFAFEQLVAPVEGDNWVLHHCDNRKCVNPDHLYQGTPIDNRRDMLVRQRWTHPYSTNTACSAGHVYTEGSFRIAKDGSRVCRECMKQHMRKYRAKLKGEPQ